MSDPKLKMQDDAVEGQQERTWTLLFAVHFHPSMNLFTDKITDIMSHWKQALVAVLAFCILILLLAKNRRIRSELLADFPGKHKRKYLVATFRK